jgi:hypothetical protein
MDAKKLIWTVVGVAAVVALVVIMVMSNSSKPAPDAVADVSPSPSSTFIPIPEQTLQGTETPQVSSEAPAPTASATASPVTSDEVPVVSPSLTPIVFDAGNGGSNEELEKSITAEEITARDTIYKVIPVIANLTSPKYKSPLDARDELVSQNLITGNMAANNFSSEYTNFERDLNKTGFTVQTTGLKCFMRTLTPQTALEMGTVSCYFTRHYVDAYGYPVNNANYVAAVGGAGSIDPNQISSVKVNVKQEGGAWKVDDIRFN